MNNSKKSITKRKKNIVKNQKVGMNPNNHQKLIKEADPEKKLKKKTYEPVQDIQEKDRTLTAIKGKSLQIKGTKMDLKKNAKEKKENIVLLKAIEIKKEIVQDLIRK